MRKIWLVLLLILLVGGCATHGARSVEYKRFNLRSVLKECARLDCVDPNVVVVRHFANIVQESGSACVVHIVKEYGQTPWKHWGEYLKPLESVLARSQLHIYAFNQRGNIGTQHRRLAKNNLTLIGNLYRYQGVVREAMVRSISTKISAITVPYRDPYCQGRPVLEIYEGTRFVSPSASKAAEHVNTRDMITKTVIVVIDYDRGA